MTRTMLALQVATLAAAARACAVAGFGHGYQWRAAVVPTMSFDSRPKTMNLTTIKRHPRRLGTLPT